MSRPPDLVQGTLDLLLLRVLALEALHGWAIAERLAAMSNGELKVSHGALYPALHKLEAEGWVTSTWGTTENNRRAKYYRLTRPGRKVLDAEVQNWKRLSAAITMVVEA